MARLIETPEDIAAGLACLVGLDERLDAVIRAAGDVPLRRTNPGFAGLARIVVGQHISVASAEATWKRLSVAVPDVSARALRRTKDEALMATGLSAAKVATLRAIVSACDCGLDLGRLGDLPADEARRQLIAIKGIGSWTADIYLLFCLGHPDVFPVGDLALRVAVADALGEEAPLPADRLRVIAERWSPWRGVAARLFWSYYRAKRHRTAVPV